MKYDKNSVAQTRNGSWNMSQLRFAKTVDLPSWTYLWISSSNQRDNAWSSTDELEETLRAFTGEMEKRGIGTSKLVKPGPRITIPDSRSVNKKIDSTFEAIATNSTKPKVVLGYVYT